jgi:hypothetical protein
MQLISRSNLAPEMMALAEDTRQGRLPRSVHGHFLPGQLGEKRHGFASPGNDDPLACFGCFHIAGQALIDLPQANSLFHSILLQRRL